MADIDVQTAQLIIQLARDDIYQLHDGAQNGGLLSDLEFALAEQEREFMQRWMNYGDAQVNPGARLRRRNGYPGNVGNVRNAGNGTARSARGVGSSHTTNAPVADPSVFANRNRTPLPLLRPAAPEPRVVYDGPDPDDVSGGDIPLLRSDALVFSGDEGIRVLSRPYRPPISVPPRIATWNIVLDEEAADSSSNHAPRPNALGTVTSMPSSGSLSGPRRSDLSPSQSNIPTGDRDQVRPTLVSAPYALPIGVPSNTATQNTAIPGHNHNNSNNSIGGVSIRRPISPVPYSNEDTVDPAPSTNILRTATSITSLSSPYLIPVLIPYEEENAGGPSNLAPRTEDIPSPRVVDPQLIWRPPSVECYFCKEDCAIWTTIQTSCHHHLCEECITRLVEVCVKDETAYPPKCCGNKLLISELTLISDSLRQRYEVKVHEYDTPTPARTYCHQCSRFLDASSLTTTTSFASTIPPRTSRYCKSCFVWTCMGCKQPNHPMQMCQETPDDRALKALAKQKGWQTCPMCTAVVERTEGCNHMTCKCGAQFCYFCATRWKQCRC